MSYSDLSSFLRRVLVADGAISGATGLLMVLAAGFGLLQELRSYPAAAGHRIVGGGDSMVLVPLRLATEVGTLNLISTTIVFGTPLDVTLSELALETFFPADADSAALLRQLANDAG